MSNDDTDFSSFRSVGIVNPDASLGLEALQSFSSGEARERAEIFSRSIESGLRREIELGSEKISAIQSAMSKIRLDLLFNLFIPLFHRQLGHRDVSSNVGCSQRRKCEMT